MERSIEGFRMLTIPTLCDELLNFALLELQLLCSPMLEDSMYSPPSRVLRKETSSEWLFI